jgi:hypothetical protein
VDGDIGFVSRRWRKSELRPAFNGLRDFPPGSRRTEFVSPLVMGQWNILGIGIVFLNTRQVILIPIFIHFRPMAPIIRVSWLVPIFGQWPPR